MASRRGSGGAVTVPACTAISRASSRSESPVCSRASIVGPRDFDRTPFYRAELQFLADTRGPQRLRRTPQRLIQLEELGSRGQRASAPAEEHVAGHTTIGYPGHRLLRSHHLVSNEGGRVVKHQSQANRLTALPHGFRVGSLYSRRKEINDRFGGNGQGGISPSARSPYIFLFTKPAREGHFHLDGWLSNDLFCYGGEGDVGDQVFRRGNKAIRDHVQSGRTLLLFETCSKARKQKFLGEFALACWEHVETPDKTGQPRRAIVFHLTLLLSQTPNDGQGVAAEAPSDQTDKSDFSLEELRARALAAAVAPVASRAEARQTVHYRSSAVRDYVLARAQGRCEACDATAPFTRKDGTPYLESHHLRRVSDGGPDHPRWVAALCPTCHRRIHYGSDGGNWNSYLNERLWKKEV